MAEEKEEKKPDKFSEALGLLAEEYDDEEIPDLSNPKALLTEVYRRQRRTEKALASLIEAIKAGATTAPAPQPQPKAKSAWEDFLSESGLEG